MNSVVFGSQVRFNDLLEGCSRKLKLSQIPLAPSQPLQPAPVERFTHRIKVNQGLKRLGGFTEIAQFIRDLGDGAQEFWQINTGKSGIILKYLKTLLQLRTGLREFSKLSLHKTEFERRANQRVTHHTRGLDRLRKC